MEDFNPYRSSPAIESDSHASRSRFDAGLMAARYLQFLGIISFIWMIVSIFLDRLNVDLSWLLLFWGARHLARHSRRARWWVIAIFGFVIAILWAGTIAAIAGVQDSSVSMFGWTLENPTVADMLVISIATSVVAGIPIWLLLTKQAKEQFREKDPGMLKEFND